jgi:hypothetical protein
VEDAQSVVQAHQRAAAEVVLDAAAQDGRTEQSPVVDHPVGKVAEGRPLLVP